MTEKQTAEHQMPEPEMVSDEGEDDHNYGDLLDGVEPPDDDLDTGK